MEEGIKQIKPDTSQLKAEVELVDKEVVNSEMGESKLNPAPPKSILEPDGLTSYSKAVEEKNDEVRQSAAKGGKAAQILLGVGIFLVALLIALGVPSFLIYGKARIVKADLDKVKVAMANKNMAEVKSSLDTTKKDLQSLGGTYNLLGWLKVVPLASAYWSDGRAAINAGVYGIDTAQEALKAVEPYADVLGFNGGEKATTGEEMVNDRIEFIVKTSGDLAPKAEEIGKKAKLAEAELSKINPDRYPKQIRGMQVRENIRKAQDIVSQATEAVSQSKPLLEVLPYLLGIDGERTYLLLFQNDKELRPTGGFITAYSLVKVNKGKFEPVSSNDIYNIDSKYKPSIPAPDPIVRYIKGPYVLNKNLRLRDMNFNPDFKVSMEEFRTEVAKAGIKNVDGIIGVDTQVVVNLLNVLGQIGVPGFGNFSTNNEPKCNCPQVIYELESFADVEGSIVWSQDDPTKIIFAPPNYENRKKIVGPLMNSILANALGQPKEKMPALFEAAWKSITEKHVLLYVFDEKAQAGVEAFNLGGRIKEYDGDYLHISDANLGGRKSNLYTTQEVVQEVKVGGDGSIEKSLTITYKNPQSYDGWLNSVLPNWTRIYVPKGSELISLEGFEEKVDPYEELGKTVFAGGFSLRPQGVVEIKVTYKLPFKVKGEYKELVQKQPGLDAPLYSITVGRNKEELFLRSDKEFKFRI